MFVGHFGVALAAKRVSPRLSLALLFAAVQLLDILWPVFIILGVEHARVVPGITVASPLDLYDFPYSHSLLLSLLWSILVALPWLLARRLREAAVLAGCVFSHFILDFVTHRPDLQVAPGWPARYGLGLWNHLAAELAIEGALFAAGIVVYLRATTNSKGSSKGNFNEKMGTIGFGALVVVLTATWLSGAFGPAPPSIQMVAVSALFAIPVFLVWAWAIDRSRPVRVVSLP